MTGTRKDDALARIDRVIASHATLKKYKSGGFYSGRVVGDDAAQFITAAVACIRGVSGNDSDYARQADRYVADMKAWDGPVSSLLGVLRTLRSDIEAGYLESFEAQIVSDVFADFLGTADNLLSEDQHGYKDAAAVLAGGVLEQHIRKLCDVYGIETTRQTDRGPKPRRAEDLNADLAREAVYSKMDQKSVTAWLDLRNDAAHGHYDKYDKQQVTFFIQWLRDFIQRTPAHANRAAPNV